MADGVFNISKGAFAEKIRDTGSMTLVLLLKVAQVDATLVDHDDVAALLAAANTEATFTNYARKTAIVETLTVDDTNDRVDVDLLHYPPEAALLFSAASFGVPLEKGFEFDGNITSISIGPLAESAANC